MAGSIKPTRGTRRRGAALLAVAAVLLSAPVAWAFGELSQKPTTAGCVSETGSGGACLERQSARERIRRRAGASAVTACAPLPQSPNGSGCVGASSPNRRASS